MNRSSRIKNSIPFLIFLIHLVLHCIFGTIGWLKPYELFTIMLLMANAVIAIIFKYKKDQDKDFLFQVSGIMTLMAAHALVGQKIAPDALTSGSMLMVNILLLYVGFKIFTKLSYSHAVAFTLSYFLLFFIFILKIENAAPLFLLALLGLAATARDLKMLTYFWALVISFTIFQPYSWHSVIILFFLLHILYSAREKGFAVSHMIFLLVGLTVVFLVLLPVLVIMFEEDPRNIFNMLNDQDVINAIKLTAITATVSTIFLVLVCVPLAYVISRFHFKGRSFLLSVIDIPIIIPQSAAGIALLRVFGKNQYIGEILFNSFGIRFDGQVLGICLAQIFVSMPFLLKSAISSFEATPPSLELNAQTLGASPFGSFYRISLPLASRGIFIGAVLAWARAAGEFGAVLFISPFPETAPIAVYNKFTSVGIAEAAPLVTTILLFSIIMFFLLQLVARSLKGMYNKEYST